MKNTHKTILTFGLLILLLVAMYLLYKGNKMKTAFVKNADLYAEFTLKKELETKLATVKNQRKTILDSLVLQLKLTATTLQNSKDENEIKKFQINKQAYLMKEKEFNEDSDRLAEQYSDQIWKQINQYVSDFGKENGYSYIYGATGDGALMYAEDKSDITAELKTYINNRYKGDKN
jgi:outer membrane protein